MNSERRFFLGMAIASLVVVLLGFGRSYGERLSSGPPMTPIVYVHAGLFVAWMLVFVAQTSLVSARRTSVHRRLGWASVALAVAMVVVGAMTALAAARRGHDPMGLHDPQAFLMLSLGDLAIFAGCVTAAYVWRRTAVVHKRLMLLATVGALLPAAIGRLPFIVGHRAIITVLLVMFLGAGAVFDRLSRGRIHPLSVWGAGLVFASIPLRLVLGQTDAWHRVASWLAG